jgi:hypothetical protein
MTRIILSIVILISISTAANAQFTKGSVLLGGQLSYAHYSSEYTNTPEQHSSYGTYTVSIGKAVSENTVAGINLTYSPYSVDNYNNYGVGPLEYKSNYYSIGIFYRKYKTLGKDFFLFGEAGANYSWSTASGKNDSARKVVDGTSNGGNIYVMPGIAYKISKKFFLELTIPSLFYIQYNAVNTNVQSNQPTKQNSDQFSVSTSLSANPFDALAIGFRLNL